ncbi:hypothetical protein DV495_003511 [Geotrichum candidum]|nr:hypothetical protein DV454_000889 [Geotrichum candidum]KAF5126492.1 hypothetical protein DV495_003511 [Geotrichum candidum]
MPETEIKPIDKPSVAAEGVQDTKGALTQDSETIKSAPVTEESSEKESEPEVIETGIKRSIDETEDATDSIKPKDVDATDVPQVVELPDAKKAKIDSAGDEAAEEDEDEDDEEFKADDAEEEEEDDDDEEEEEEEEEEEPEIIEGEDDLNLAATIERAESELEVGATPTAAEA